MRAPAISLVLALALVPGLALAQAGPPPSGPGAPPPGASGPPPPPPGAITRDQYIERAQEAAGRRFDDIDTSHVGYITRAQMRAWSQRRRGGAAPAGGPPTSQSQ